MKLFEDMSKVLLITDLDGTFLPSNKVLSEVDLDAVRKFRNMGGKFTIATGRTLQSVQCYFDQLQLNIPFILYNGAIIYDLEQEKSLLQKELPLVSREIISDVLNEMPEVACEILTLDNIYIARSNEVEDRHVELCKVNPIYMELDKIPNGGWVKVLFAMEPEILPKLTSYIDSKGYNEVDFVKSANIFYEMLPKNCSKGSALKDYIEKVGLEDYKIIAVGDYHNDIEMINVADLGVATANAQPEVKKAADLILKKTNNEGAISELIDYIL
ncbi:MAG: HAD family phosphatase [Clostridiales bacterium]|jgi:Cof subfamily protein (haloacid dehalogenase superfamily)|nr:HAD family phosphatase [Clostridiales bacterium]